MKIFITLILLTYIPLSVAKIALSNDCSNYKEVAESDFILFNKTEFIQLGECVGRSLLQKGKLTHLVEACNEVIEDNISPLGILSLSKVEAIQIGQCFGAVKYTHDRYQGQQYDYYSDKTYHCTQGIEAAQLLSLKNKEFKSSKDIRSAICYLY